MQTYLDDRLLDADHATLADALSAGAAEAERDGRVVVEIAADGRGLTDDELDAPQSATGFAEVRLVSADPNALVSVTLHDAAEALASAVDAQTEAARLIHTGDVQGALNRLASVLEIWQAARDSVEKGAALLDIELSEIKLGEDNPERCASDLATSLAALKSGVARQDWSETADLLEFDLAELAGRWRGFMTALADRASGTGDAR